MSEVKNLEGIGGWLIMIVIVLFGTSISTFFEMISHAKTYGIDIVFMFLFVYEIAVVYTMILFFKKQQAFRSWFMGVLIAESVMLVLAAAGGLNGGQIFGMLIRLGILIPYLVKSKRVKATFVN